MELRNRKQLPDFAVLPSLRFDIQKLVEHCQTQNLFNFDAYNDIKLSSNSKMSPFVWANQFSKHQFFTEEDSTYLEGEKYKQLYLTEFKLEVDEVSNFPSPPNSILGRQKRLMLESKNYDPVTDERNYGKRNQHVSGILNDILDAFESPVTRVRLAYLAPHFSLKPHVDYDPSYITRYHIPIKTNTACTMHVRRRGVERNCHFVADGRVYFLNAGHIHWAQNQSHEPRLHLIVDTHGQADLIKGLREI